MITSQAIGQKKEKKEYMGSIHETMGTSMHNSITGERLSEKSSAVQSNVRKAMQSVFAEMKDIDKGTSS